MQSGRRFTAQYIECQCLELSLLEVALVRKITFVFVTLTMRPRSLYASEKNIKGVL